MIDPHDFECAVRCGKVKCRGSYIHENSDGLFEITQVVGLTQYTIILGNIHDVYTDYCNWRRAFEIEPIGRSKRYDR